MQLETGCRTEGVPVCLFFCSLFSFGGANFWFCSSQKQTAELRGYLSVWLFALCLALGETICDSAAVRNALQNWGCTIYTRICLSGFCGEQISGAAPARNRSQNWGCVCLVSAVCLALGEQISDSAAVRSRLQNWGLSVCLSGFCSLFSFEGAHFWFYSSHKQVAERCICLTVRFLLSVSLWGSTFF